MSTWTRQTLDTSSSHAECIPPLGALSSWKDAHHCVIHECVIVIFEWLPSEPLDHARQACSHPLGNPHCEKVEEALWVNHRVWQAFPGSVIMRVAIACMTSFSLSVSRLAALTWCALKLFAALFPRSLTCGQASGVHDSLTTPALQIVRGLLVRNDNPECCQRCKAP